MRIPETKIILLACMAAHVALTLTFALTLHYSFKTSSFDTTVYEQLMYNFLGGRGLTCSVNPPYIPQFWLGFHFSPILYLLTPFYYVFPHVHTLLVVGSTAVALAAWPIFLMAEELLGSAKKALLIALIYLFHPFVFNGTAWNFHETDFAPLCIAWMLWAVMHKKQGLLFALSIVLLSIKEHYGLSVAGFGFLWAWHWREIKSEVKFGLLLAAFGITVLSFILLVFLPYFSPMGMPAMLSSEAQLLGHFSWLTSAESIKAHIEEVLSDDFRYGVNLLLPFFLLPLASFAWLLPAAADAGVNALSGTDFMRDPLSYHSTPLIPIILIAFCQSLNTFFRCACACVCGRRRLSPNQILTATTVAMLGFAYTMLVLPLSSFGDIWEVSSPKFSYNEEDRKALSEIEKLIPPDAPVASQITVLPHLKVRYKMTPFPMSFDNADYIVLRLVIPFKRDHWRHGFNMIMLTYGSPMGYYFYNIESIFQHAKWGVVYYSDRWMVFQKDVPGDPELKERALAAVKAEEQECRDFNQGWC
jgi:uncharacterized membrane protein